MDEDEFVDVARSSRREMAAGRIDGDVASSPSS